MTGVSALVDRGLGLREPAVPLDAVWWRRAGTGVEVTLLTRPLITSEHVHIWRK